MGSHALRQWVVLVAIALMLASACAVPLRKLTVIRASQSSSESSEESSSGNSTSSSNSTSSGSSISSSAKSSSASSGSSSFGSSSSSSSSSGGSSSESSRGSVSGSASSGSSSSASAKSSSSKSESSSSSSSSSSESSESTDRSAVPFSEQVANTLNGLTAVLEKIHSEVESDERVFKVFKQKVLEDEIAKSGKKLDWPAVKDIIRAEVAVGRKQVENQGTNFKIDVLDVIQKGLDTLRGEVRDTMTSTYAAGRMMADQWDKMAKSESSADVPANKAEAVQAVLSAPEPVPKAVDSPNFDEDDITGRFPDKMASASLDSLVRALDAVVIPQDREAIKRYIAARMDNSRAVLQARTQAPQSRGMSAEQALAQLRSELQGKLSARDLNTELFDRLSVLTKHHLLKPTAETAEALRQVRRSILASLQKMEEQASDLAVPSGSSSGSASGSGSGSRGSSGSSSSQSFSSGSAGSQSNVNSLDALQRRINALHERTIRAHSNSGSSSSVASAVSSDQSGVYADTFDDDLKSTSSGSSAAAAIPSVQAGSASALGSQSARSFGGSLSASRNLQSTGMSLTSEQERQLNIRLGENHREPEMIDPKSKIQIPEMVEKKKRQEFPLAPAAVVENDEIVFDGASSASSSTRSSSSEFSAPVSTQIVKPQTVSSVA